MWRDAGSGELHAKFFDSPPNGSHALPPTVQVVAQPVAPRIEQSVARQRHGTADTADAHNLPTSPMTAEGAAHRLPVKQAPTRGAASRPPRGHAQTPDETTAFNTDFPASTSQKVTIQPPRFGLSPKRPITRRRLVTTKRERGPLPGLLTVDYFTTSPGGILAPHTRVSSVSRKTRVRHQAAQQHTS